MPHVRDWIESRSTADLFADGVRALVIVAGFSLVGSTTHGFSTPGALAGVAAGYLVAFVTEGSQLERVSRTPWGVVLTVIAAVCFLASGLVMVVFETAFVGSGMITFGVAHVVTAAVLWLGSEAA